MRILALDLASVVGWACGSADAARKSHGILKLPKTGEDLGRFGVAFRNWLGAAIEELAPGEIIYEMPILPAATALMTIRKLNGLCMLTETVAADYKIPCLEEYLQKIRKHFIGTSKAPKEIQDRHVRSMWLKERTVSECRSRGFRVADHNDADACALLSLRLSQLRKDYRLVQVEPAKSADEFVARCAA